MIANEVKKQLHIAIEENKLEIVCQMKNIWQKLFLKCQIYIKKMQIKTGEHKKDGNIDSKNRTVLECMKQIKRDIQEIKIFIESWQNCFSESEASLSDTEDRMEAYVH